MSKPAAYVESVIACWANCYVDLNKMDKMPEGETKTRIANKGFATEVVAGRHQPLADEPPCVGEKIMESTFMR
ncbi:MAG: hypothetical protein AAGI25_03860 [Bacteroidota bacterium]